jgi:hypothetical protein
MNIIFWDIDNSLSKVNLINSFKCATIYNGIEPRNQNYFHLELIPKYLDKRSLGSWVTNSWFPYTFLVWCQQQYFVFIKVLYIISSDFTIHRYLLSKQQQSHPFLFCWSADCTLLLISIYFG